MDKENRERPEGLENTIDDEILRCRVRKVVGEGKPDSRWKSISANPLTGLLVGFVLTGILGVVLTDYYNTKQRQLEFELNNLQRDRERQKDERAKLAEEARNLQEALREEAHDDRQRALEREKDERLKQLEFTRSLYQKELEWVRTFSDELNKNRIAKISEVWEKVYIYQSLTEAALPQLTFPPPIPPNSSEEFITSVLEENRKRNDEIMKPSVEIKIQLEQLLDKNRFWLEDDNYSGVKQYIDLIPLYSVAFNTNNKVGFTELEQRRLDLRRTISQIRDELMAEGIRIKK